MRMVHSATSSHMSMESQSKVMEDPDFERIYAELDSVKLWKVIRRSHLTHIYGDDDEMSFVSRSSMGTSDKVIRNLLLRSK